MSSAYAKPDSVMEVAESLGNWLGLGAGAGGGFYAVRWFLEWLSGRHDKREAHLDLATENLIRALEDRLNAVMTRLDSAESALEDCKRRHAESEAQVLRLEATLRAQGDARQHAQLIIAAEKRERKEPS